jgi:hypothetical protein
MKNALSSILSPYANPNLPIAATLIGAAVGRM